MGLRTASAASQHARLEFRFACVRWEEPHNIVLGFVSLSVCARKLRYVYKALLSRLDVLLLLIIAKHSSEKSNNIPDSVHFSSVISLFAIGLLQPSTMTSSPFLDG
jgi:hypothetical protein